MNKLHQIFVISRVAEEFLFPFDDIQPRRANGHAHHKTRHRCCVPSQELSKKKIGEKYYKE